MSGQPRNRFFFLSTGLVLVGLIVFTVSYPLLELWIN